MAQDLALFVVFFDLMLVPFYFLTGSWGGPGRVPATIKLFIYTLVGSLLMLAAAIATGVLAAGRRQISLRVLATSRRGALSSGSQDWIFLCFAAAFLVKMPAFPFHGWMPDGYRAMPLPVLAVFSGVLSKVAAYGFLRDRAAAVPRRDACTSRSCMLLIALASILYGSAMAFTTTNARLDRSATRRSPSSASSRSGSSPCGPRARRARCCRRSTTASSSRPRSSSSALLAARAGGSEDLRDMGGIAFRAPVLAALFLIVALATLAMPGSSNFVGEFLILLGVFKAKIVIAVIAFAGVVMASVYALRLFIRAMHNRVGPTVDVARDDGRATASCSCRSCS